MRAILLAAGEGKRLRASFNRPKPLVHLLGLSLLERNILSLKECGIKEFVIINGCYAQEIESYLGNGTKLGVQIKYLYNPEWQLGNGVSAYTFKKEHRQDEKFILMMADHLFDLHVLREFISQEQNLRQDQLLLAADRNLDNVFDLDECTKVEVSGNLAKELGKDLKNFSAVDCGLFMGTGALLETLATTIEQGLYTLTDAVNVMAREGRVKLHFVDGNWIDVDDEASYRQAEKMLLKGLIPPKDGLISKIFNRHISLRITKQVAKTQVSPNQITFLSVITAVASALAFSTNHPLIGGLLAQFCSILDGVDGEIARLKFLQSNYGALFDSILDRYGDFIIVIGMTYGWYIQTSNPLVPLIGSIALAGIPMSMLFKEKFHALTGKTYLSEIHDGVFRYLPANRDGRLFLIMLGGIFNQLGSVLILLAVITHFQALLRLVKAKQLVQN